MSCPYQSLALLCRLCFCDIHKFCFSSLSPLSASLAAHNTVFQSCLSKVRSGQETCYASVFKIRGYVDRSSERAGQPLLKFRENLGCTGHQVQELQGYLAQSLRFCRQISNARFVCSSAPKCWLICDCCSLHVLLWLLLAKSSPYNRAVAVV